MDLGYWIDKQGNTRSWKSSSCFSELATNRMPDMFRGQIDLDDDGYVKTEHNVVTTRQGVQLHGVYACGDVQERRYRQPITAAGAGCMAALEVEYLEELGQ